MSGARTGLLVSASAGAPCSRRLSPLRLRSSTPGPTPSPRAVAVETSDTLVGCSGGISVRARLADAMTGLRGLLDASNALVRRHLDADEQVMAIGRCDEVTGRGDPDPYAGGWTFIMVTTRKLRWVPRANPRFEASLDFDDVMAISESLHGHRYRIGLRHVPIPRLRHVPAHRFATFAWGNRTEVREVTRTDLVFSRRDTEAASALRRQLSLRGASWPSPASVEPVRTSSRRKQSSNYLVSRPAPKTGARDRFKRRLRRIWESVSIRGLGP